MSSKPHIATLEVSLPVPAVVGTTNNASTWIQPSESGIKRGQFHRGPGVGGGIKELTLQHKKFWPPEH